MNKEEVVSIVQRYISIPALSLGRLWDLCNERPLPPGSIVECGVCNGGSAALIWAACGGNARRLWMFDSWEGLPMPTAEDGGRARSKWDHHMQAFGQWCKGDIETARQAALHVGCLENNLFQVKGWFADTLPFQAAKAFPIACLHIDADWYASVTQCLEHLWPQVAAGGLVIFNDWGYWPGCEQAAREYFERNGIDINGLVKPVTTGAWIWKEG